MKKNKLERILEKKSSRKYYAQHDIQFFAEFYFSDLFNFPTPKFHKEWIDFYKNENRIAIACPRGHAKSTWWTLIFIIHAILYKKKKFIVLLSDTQQQANALLGQIIEQLETNERISRDFGRIAGYIPPSAEEKKKWTTNDIVTTTKIRVSAYGFGSKLRGLKHDGGRPDLIVLDDVENDQSVLSTNQRNKYKNIFKKSVLNLGDEKTQVVIIGTILHFDSLLNSIINNPPPNYKTKLYRAIEGEKILWNERWNFNDMENKKLEIGSIAFEQEFQNNPLSDKDTIFKLENYYSELPKNLKKYAYVDLAISEKETADYTAFCTIGIDENGNAYVIDPVQFRGDVYTQLQKLFSYYSKHKHVAIGIESVAYQKAFYQLCLKESKKQGIYLPVKEIKVHKDKVMRAKEVSVYVDNSTIKFNPIHEDFNFQLQNFPLSDHDDLVDAFTGAVQVSGILKNDELVISFI